MDRERYLWFRTARALVEGSLEARREERKVLDDAAEAFLLARSHDEDLDETIASASWALTHLTATGILPESQARSLWEAICACGPPELGAAGFQRGETAPAEVEVAGRSGRIL